LLDLLKPPILITQEFYQLAFRAVRNIFRRPHYVDDVALQMDIIGVGSLPIAILTGFFSGAVMALQMSRALATYGAVGQIGQIVAITLVRELGPVLTALVVAGRNSSGMASELGSMKVTEQIDAMRAIGADPIRHLVVPRFVATFLLIPFLTIYCDFVGILGGYFVTWSYGVDTYEYWMHSADVIENFDLFTGVFKSGFFGAAIALIACYKGFQSRQGAEGVGRAATESFVVSFMAILVLDFFIVMFLQALYDSLWGRTSIFV